MDAKTFSTWAFGRCLGVRDAGRACAPDPVKDRPHWGTIYVFGDSVVGEWKERAVEDGVPVLYTTTLVNGTERLSFGSEYWLDVRRDVLAPVVPKRVRDREILFKLGKDCTALNKCSKDAPGWYGMILRPGDFTHLIIGRADAKFEESRRAVRDVEVWATYD